MNTTANETVDLVGPLCTPLDTLARNITLPKAELDDLIGIFQSGAYGLTASPVNFLSHAIPAEILVSNGTAQLIGGHGIGGHGRSGEALWPSPGRKLVSTI
jgi:diaminopimelate decarboxylase